MCLELKYCVHDVPGICTDAKMKLHHFVFEIFIMFIILWHTHNLLSLSHSMSAPQKNLKKKYCKHYTTMAPSTNIIKEVQQLPFLQHRDL